MCGIAGFLTPGQISATHDSVIFEMLSSLRHRGPDDSGIWRDKTTGITLGHRRLSILDLSPAGHQPMISSCGHLVIVYNGEIYKHDALSKEITYRQEAGGGYSDTEHSLIILLPAGVCRNLLPLRHVCV